MNKYHIINACCIINKKLIDFMTYSYNEDNYLADSFCNTNLATEKSEYTPHVD